MSKLVKTEAGLWVPPDVLPKSVGQAQMSKPIVFWWNKKRDHIMNAPGPYVAPPTGYERIECRHAHEVDTWSNRLRAQEKRIREMTDEEHYVYEDAIRFDMIEQLKKDLSNCHDEKNRLFITAAIQYATESREKARPAHIKYETTQACEAEEGIAS